MDRLLESSCYLLKIGVKPFAETAGTLNGHFAKKKDAIGSESTQNQ